MWQRHRLASVPDYDAVVVGSGPNGMAAAVAVAREGWKVLVVEAEPTLGGGSRTEELTLPGFLHDTCSAVHPMGVASPFFRTLPPGRPRPRVGEPRGADRPSPRRRHCRHPAPLPRRHRRTTRRRRRGVPPRYRAHSRRAGDCWRIADGAVAAATAASHRHGPLRNARAWPSSTFARAGFKTEQARALFAGTRRPRHAAALEH